MLRLLALVASGPLAGLALALYLPFAAVESDAVVISLARRAPTVHESELVPRSALFVPELDRQTALERARAPGDALADLLTGVPAPEPLEPSTDAVAASAPPPVSTPVAASVPPPPSAECPAIIVVSFPDAGTACAVSQCESHWNPESHNTNAYTGDDSVGLFQINLHANLLPGRIAMLNSLGYPTATRDEAVAWLKVPEVNVRMALVISGGGYSWGAWRNCL